MAVSLKRSKFPYIVPLMRTQGRRTKRALITGITGQDGSYLAELLDQKGYKIFGLIRRTSNDPLVRLWQNPAIKRKINFIYGNLRDSSSIERALLAARPDEIYNLAAQSDVGISFECPEETMEVNYYGVGRLLNAVLKICPRARVYQASTSEMFGSSKPPQDETTPFKPVSPYGESKLKAYEDFVKTYRKNCGLFVASGILFNHESPRRGEHFVTRKISMSLAKIKLGLQDKFELGNLNAKRDWGYAADYVEAIWFILQYREPEDFVIANGESHYVREFVELAAEVAGVQIRWHGRGLREFAIDDEGKVILTVNEKFYRPREVMSLCGNAAKARRLLGWKPKTSFRQLVKLMVDSDLRRFLS